MVATMKKLNEAMKRYKTNIINKPLDRKTPMGYNGVTILLQLCLATENHTL